VPGGEPFVAVPKVEAECHAFRRLTTATCAFSPGSYELVEDGEETYNIEGGAELGEPEFVFGPA
jgi:hypothetical protein